MRPLPATKMVKILDKKAQKEALDIARKTLEAYFAGQSFQPSVRSSSLKKKMGAFVTLKKEGQLRGCIGQFAPPYPLWQTIQKMTLAAAFQDPRFPPLQPTELEQVTIEISVMTPRKPIRHWQEIRLGEDGVVIEKDGREGVFLPQVAQETGWSLEEFLSQLCWQKAGLPPDCYRHPETKIYTFQVQIITEERKTS